jgi:ABC-type glycerol-3-phosphate transport system substrate-binding protein
LFKDALLKYVAPNDVDVKWNVDADQVFVPAVAAGTPPDIGTGHHYIQYMSTGVLRDVGPLVATSKVITKDNYPPPNWDGSFYQGVMYGIPAIECFLRRGLNYNTQMVGDAGLDPKNPPATWEDLLTWHKALTKFDGAGNLRTIGLDSYDAEASAWSSDGYYQAESFGAKWFDPESKTFNLDSAEMAESFDMMGEFIKIIGPDNLASMRKTSGQGTWGGSYDAQVQAMIIEGYWHPGETFAEKPEVSKLNACTWVPVPARRKGAKMQFAGGHMVLMYKTAKNPPDQVFKVAEFLQTKEHCDPVFKKIGWLPAYKPFINATDPSIYPGLDFYFKSLNDPETEWHGWLKCEIESFLEPKVAEVREKHYRGDFKTGKEAAAFFQDAAVTEYKQAGFSK